VGTIVFTGVVVVDVVVSEAPATTGTDTATVVGSVSGIVPATHDRN
jgi:hypothetical protein